MKFYLKPCHDASDTSGHILSSIAQHAEKRNPLMSTQYVTKLRNHVEHDFVCVSFENQQCTSAQVDNDNDILHIHLKTNIQT